MKKNRKRADTYRFNGLSGLRPVGIAELEVLIEQFEAKLADPHDADDKRWTTRWLQRFQRELAKKQKSLEQKQAESGSEKGSRVA